MGLPSFLVELSMAGTLEILVITSERFGAVRQHLDAILEIAPNGVITAVEETQVTLDRLRRAEIIFGAPDPDRLFTAERLKWLHLPSSGADRYVDRNLFCNKDVLLTNSHGVGGGAHSRVCYSRDARFQQEFTLIRPAEAGESLEPS